MDKLQFFKEFTFLVTSHANTDLAMEQVFSYVRQVMPLDAMSWILYDAETGSLRMLKFRDSRGFHELNERIVPISLKARQWIEALDREKVLLVNRSSKNPLAEAIVKELSEKIGPGEKSLFMFWQQITGSGPLGFTCYFAEGPNRYSSDQIELVKLLARVVSFACSNMMRYMELEKLKDRLSMEKDILAEELRRITEVELIGADSGLREIMNAVKQLASVDTPVLIIGETGVGKELVANAIQQASPRRDGPYVKVNCGAIPDTLIDSELFGHEKGAFTGATSRRKGRFERASGGTIFLDEIGELPLKAQVRMLRVLQNQEIERVGGTEPISVNLRFIIATHRDLMKMVNEGSFREDLFYRLNVFPVVVPPLRHRKQDIPSLVNHFIDKKAKDMKLRHVPKIGKQALRPLTAHHWPGNIRELENLVERALLLNPRGPLHFDHLLPPSLNVENNGDHEVEDEVTPLNTVMRRHIIQALALAKGKINGPGGAAQLLKIHPGTLRKRMDKLGVPYGRKAKI